MKNIFYSYLLTISLTLSSCASVRILSPETHNHNYPKKEIKNDKKYRECEINFDDFKNDLILKKEILEFSEIEVIFKNLKTLFESHLFYL